MCINLFLFVAFIVNVDVCYFKNLIFSRVVCNGRQCIQNKIYIYRESDLIFTILKCLSYEFEIANSNVYLHFASLRRLFGRI